MAPKRIGFLLFPEIQALDIAGAMDAFATAEVAGSSGREAQCYELTTIGLTLRPVRASSGLLLKPQCALAGAPPLDTLIVPGGAGIREPGTSEKVGEWIKSHADRLRRVVGICTGVYGLAASGLLQDRRVTTHWRFVRDLGSRFPSLDIDPDALFIKDGPFYTSAGITAGIDLSLALIEEDYGQPIALAVARELVVYLKRSGGQAQYSEPLRFQSQAGDRVSHVAGWIMTNLDKDLSVEALARRACLGPKQFTRRFWDVFHTTPAAFVESARLDEARNRLLATATSIARVAASVGFRNADVFRRRFASRFGVPPGSYRSRFSTSADPVRTEKSRLARRPGRAIAASHPPALR